MKLPRITRRRAITTLAVGIPAAILTVPNALYGARRREIDADAYIDAFETHVRSDPEVGMAYGRISVSPRDSPHSALLAYAAGARLPAGARILRSEKEMGSRARVSKSVVREVRRELSGFD